MRNRLAAFGVALLVLGSSSVRGQEAGTGDRAPTQASAPSPAQGPEAPTARSAAAEPSPRELVAARIREALREPESPEAWEELARALPSVESDGAPETPASVIAGAYAREAAGAGVVAPEPVLGVRDRATRIVGRAGAGLEAGLGYLGLPPSSTVPVLGLFGLVLTLAGAAAIRRHALPVRARTRNRESPAARRDPRDLALGLASSGVPLGEIARRTGMARDALALLLALPAPASSPPVTAGQVVRARQLSPGAAPTLRTRPRPAADTAALAAIRDRAAALKDGRLTYGRGES